MKRETNWQISLALILLTLSFAFYSIHYVIFRDLHHIFLYLIGDVAFLFIDVLIVMLVLHRLLMYREKQSVLRKLNMVIGTFFSEVGVELLKRCIQFDGDVSGVGSQLLVKAGWPDRKFDLARKGIRDAASAINSKKGDLGALKSFLVGKRQFLLGLLDNPNLLEHETFTNLLWAVFHLTDELAHRPAVTNLPEPDYQHLSGDIKRAYHQLIIQWLSYMQHLQRDYPYLFSLAARTNPFDPAASVVVTE